MSASSGYGGGSGPVGPSILTITGNNAVAVEPDISQNINLVGSGGVLVEGNASDNTLTFNIRYRVTHGHVAQLG